MSAEQDVDRVAEIERLATLEAIDYESARIDAVKRLGLRASVLDREVAKKRRAFGLDTDNDNGQGRAVKIIDVVPWHLPVDGDQVATTLAAAFKTYAVLPDAAADVIALWVLCTWRVNDFTVSPRLAITSPTKGCGKTTILRLLNKVVRRPKRAGSISPAALFRVVEQFQPTILLDETEKYIEHGSELHALLNEGHCKGGTVLRVLGEKLELREFAIFGAIAFARNGQLPDDLEQRSIVIEMQRRRSNEELSELRDDRCESLNIIARMCARWADDNYLSDTDPDMGGLINRTADNWRPLFAIADVIGSDWPERIRDAAAVLASRESGTSDIVLLGDIRGTFADKKADRLFSSQIADALHEIEGRPWAEFGKDKKPISKNALARLLKGFKIVPRTVRIGENTAKGYHLHQFDDVFERYLGPGGLNEPSQRNTPTATGTSTAFSNVTEKVDVTHEQCEKPPRHNGSYGVTVQNGGNGLEGGNDAGERVVEQNDDLEIPKFLDRRPQADAAHLEPNGCDHCHRPSTAGDGLVEAFAGGAPARLHRGCLDAWKSGMLV